MHAPGGSLLPSQRYRIDLHMDSLQLYCHDFDYFRYAILDDPNSSVKSMVSIAAAICWNCGGTGE